MVAETFEIVVRGGLPERIIGELGGLRVVERTRGRTRLRGVLPDQARLLGILELLRGLHVEIESVTVGGTDAV